MTNMVPVHNTSASRLCYVNDAPTAAITNTTTETSFDSIFTFPSQAQHYVAPTACIRVRCAGIFSTAAVLTNIILRTRWGGTAIQSTGEFTLPILQTNMPWWIQGFILVNSVGGSAQMESQFFTVFDGNATMTNRQKNATPISFDTVDPHDIAFSAQWTTASASNSIELRAMVVEVDGP